MDEEGATHLRDWTDPPRPGPMALKGAHVRLEPLGARHAKSLHAATAGDDRIWDFLPYGPFDAVAHRAWVEAMAGLSDPRFFAVTCAGAAGPDGVLALMRVAPEHGSIEVGHIRFGPALQRSRAATEALFLVLDWAFGIGYRRFEWKCDARNLPSRRAAQRLGFAFEGVFRQHMIVKGRNRDTAWFAMTDGDWTRLRAANAAWLEPGNFDATGRQRQRLSSLTAPSRAASDPALAG